MAIQNTNIIALKKDKEVLYLMCVRCKDNTMKSGDNK